VRLRILSLLVVPVVILASSCGYHLVGHGGRFPAGVDLVAVPIFENATKDKAIARRLTNHFIRELMATGKVKVVPSAEAQAEVRGRVARYEVEPITFNANRRATENRLVVAADVDLFLKGESEPIFSEKGVTRYSEYPVSENLSELQKEEERAVEDVSLELSRKIITLMTEGF
jgi:outer membrane lipopolysaccharide assembly protein LptE/RlpB